jgi:hypothetical protein
MTKLMCSARIVAFVAAVMIGPGVVHGLFANTVQAPGSRQGANAGTVPPAPGPDYVEIVNARGQRSQLALSAIKKASSGPIVRGGDNFEFTPLLAVMKAAGIPDSAHVRISGIAPSNGKAANEITLVKGSTADRDSGDFGFIFNRRGRPVLTPRPGTTAAAAAVTSQRPQVVDVTRIVVVGK